MWAAMAVLGAAVCFGTVAAAQAIADVEASPLAIGAARLVVGGAALTLIALVIAPRAANPPSLAETTRNRRWSRQKGVVSAPGARPRSAAAPRRVMHSAVIVAIGAAGVLAFQPLYLLGARENGVAVGTVIAIGSAPIITGIIDAGVSRRLPSARWAVATALAVTGVVLTSGLVGAADGTALGIPGILSSVGAGASYATYAVASKQLLERGWSFTAAMGHLFGWAGLVSVAILAVTGLDGLLSVNGIALVLWLALVATVLAYLLFGWGLRSLRAPTVATLTLAEPLTATILGVAVLREQLTPIAVVGLVLIVAGLVTLSIPARRPAPAPADSLVDG